MNNKKESETDQCVVCSKDTGILKNTNIAYRNFYVEGAGQLCRDCWKDIYGE